jgi:hypothetical protein
MMPATGRFTGIFHRAARRMRHLADEDLLALIETATSDAHLDSCERCATRHAELLCIIADLDVVHAEADAAFDEERLLHQRTHILRRLDKNHGPARVLPFPAAAEGAGGIRVFASTGRRWIAAAAIAGLVVGIFSGRLVTNRHRESPDDRFPQAYSASVRRSAIRPVIVPAELRTSGRDELLFEEVESALARPRVQELTAIDAITPAAR